MFLNNTNKNYSILYSVLVFPGQSSYMIIVATHSILNAFKKTKFKIKSFMKRLHMYILCSQCVPMKPDTHAHVYVLAKSMQLAPF